MYIEWSYIQYLPIQEMYFKFHTLGRCNVLWSLRSAGVRLVISLRSLVGSCRSAFSFMSPSLFFYHLEYLNYCLHLQCYTHNVSADASFFKYFLSNSGAYTKPRTEPFYLIHWVESVLILWTINKYKCWTIVNILCYLPGVRIEPATSWWFYLKELLNQTPISVAPCDYSEW